jgi:hypothetical protein
LGFALLASAAGVAATSPNGDEEALCIILRVHDYVGVPSEVLADSLVETATILHSAGVEVSFVVKDYAKVPRTSLAVLLAKNAMKLHKAGLHTDFVDCARSAPTAEGEPTCQRVDLAVLVVSIVPRRMAPQAGLAPGEMGFTPTGEGGRPTHAYVLYDSVNELSNNNEQFSRRVLLGLALAHEIGHLLLGENSHSSGGLMRSPWVASDLCFTCRPKFVFTSGQSWKIRGEVRARIESASGRLEVPSH